MDDVIYILWGHLKTKMTNLINDENRNKKKTVQVFFIDICSFWEKKTAQFGHALAQT